MSRARKPAAPNAAGAEALVCTPRMLPRSKWVAAARNAVDVNPVNHPPIERLGRLGEADGGIPRQPVDVLAPADPVAHECLGEDGERQLRAELE